jgi:hypothetical protein
MRENIVDLTAEKLPVFPQHWMRVIKQHISRIDITKK